MKKTFVTESEKHVLQGFLHAKYPAFAKLNDIANQNVEYLLGLCQRCLEGDKNLLFPLTITVEEEELIRKFIIDNCDNADEWVFYYLMKSVRIILEKYYNRSGNKCE